MLSQKRRIRTAQRDAARTAFVKRYHAPPEFSFPKDFDLSRHDLLLCESIHVGTETAVLLYWVSAERAAVMEPTVLRALQLAKPEALGQVTGVRTPQMPRFFENAGKVAVLITSLFGVLSAFRDNFTEYFAAPDVVIFAGNPAPANLHAGDPIDIPIVVRNQARVGQADVHMLSAQLAPAPGSSGNLAKPASLNFDIDQVTQVQAGQNANVHLKGASPTLLDAHPTIFLLDVDASASEGSFRCRRKASYHPFPITLWPDRYSETQVVQMDPAAAGINVVLGVGAASPSGLNVQILFTSPAEVAPGDIVLMHGVRATSGPLVVPGPTGFLAKVEFQTGPLQPFHKYSYAVSIAFTRPLTEVEWNALRSSLRVRFG